MLADQHRDALPAMLMQERQHVAMPEGKDDRGAFAAQAVDTRVAIDESKTPGHSQQSHQRHSQSHDPSKPASALSLRATRARANHAGGRARLLQLASRRAFGLAISMAMSATRRDAPAVPSDSRTRASSRTIAMRSGLP